MHALIENNRESIADLCRRHGVRRLEVFGSILREDFDPARNDVDVLVEFAPQAASSFSNFLELKASLAALFGRSVDLVELNAIRNRRLRYYIEKDKLPVCLHDKRPALAASLDRRLAVCYRVPG